MKILDREPRWFEWGVKEAIHKEVNRPMLDERPKIDSLSLMKNEGSSENSDNGIVLRPLASLWENYWIDDKKKTAN